MKSIPQQASLRKPSEIDAPQMGTRNIPLCDSGNTDWSSW